MIGIVYTKARRSERVTGFEPVSLPWEGNIEPLNYTRLNSAQLTLARDDKNISGMN